MSEFSYTLEFIHGVDNNIADARAFPFSLCFFHQYSFFPIIAIFSIIVVFFSIFNYFNTYYRFPVNVMIVSGSTCA